MATIENSYTGDGSTVLFSFTFEYIEQVDVEVSVDSVTIATTEYSLANSTTIEFNTAPASGAAIRIYRNTTVNNPKATFFPGSAIRAQDLNDNFEQILFVTQEADAISERAELAADQAQIATTAALAASATATTAATSAQAAASTAQAQVNAAQTAASNAATDANTAITTANSAVATANTANTNSTSANTNAAAAVATANTANTNASAAAASAAAAQSSATTAATQAGSAATSANAAQASATSAQTSASNATSSAASAVSTANTANSTANNASSDASTALTAANNAVSTANSASSTANTASTNASAAVTTANSAQTVANSAVSTANTAVSTANTASTNASTAITDAATAQTTANGAVTTANAATTTANTASSLATTTAAAVANAYLFNNVTAVANIPSSPSDGDAVRVVNSTGVESSSVIQGVPSGFVGDSGINVEIIYSSSAGKWNYIAYNANDPDDRYGYPPYVDVTRQNTVDAAALSGVALNSTHLGTFTGSTISDASTIKNALQNLETEVETKADLVGGVVPTSQLPALAVTEFLGTVANQTAMLALTGQRGDFAIRSDTGTTFVLTSDGGSSLSHWQELATPTDSIQTVNGQTGTVVLGPSDVGAVSAASGGTFSGNVEIGTGIDLNTNGSAEFASTVVIAPDNGRQIELADTPDGGFLYLREDDGTRNILLKGTDGSATFGGDLTAANDKVKLATGSGHGYIQVKNSSGTSNITLLGSDGSASFAGSIEAVLNSTYKSVIANNGTIALYGANGLGAYLDNDGSATFLGTVKSSATANTFAALNDGYIVVQNPGGQSDDLLFRGRTAAGSEVIEMFADGSATFTGAVETSGKFESDRTVASHTVLRGALNGSETSLISADGSATFDGNVTVGDYQSGTAGKNGFQFRATGELVQNRNGGDAYTLYNNSSAKTVIISANGTATFAGNVTAFSDIRLKKDIELIPNALDKVLSLRGVTFTDKETEDRRTGVIAQDVQAVLPEAVIEGEEYLSVAYGNLVGLLIESIKELEARVSELELL